MEFSIFFLIYEVIILSTYIYEEEFKEKGKNEKRNK
jgi:hypothetical protein